MKKNRILIIIGLVAVALIAQQLSHTAFATTESCCSDGRCTGSSNCRVCTNCTRCAHCKSGGTCGVCASYTPPPKYTPPKKTKPKALPPQSSSSALGSYYINSTTLNVRSGPSTNGQVLCTLNYGDHVTVLSWTNDAWAKISTTACTGLVTGYVSGKFISKK